METKKLLSSCQYYQISLILFSHIIYWTALPLRLISHVYTFNPKTKLMIKSVGSLTIVSELTDEQDLTQDESELLKKNKQSIMLM